MDESVTGTNIKRRWILRSAPGQALLGVDEDAQFGDAMDGQRNRGRTTARPNTLDAGLTDRVPGARGLGRSRAPAG